MLREAWLPLSGVVWLALTIPAHAVLDDPLEPTVAPILLNRCVECHNPNDASGGLDLTSPRSVIEVLSPGDPDESYLIQRVVDGEMPPPKQAQPRELPPEELQALRDWVARGAPWPEDRVLDPFEATTDSRAGRDWWSLQPIRRPPVPHLPANQTLANPIDVFIGDRLAERGWTHAPPTDRRTLIRRIHFDMIGLPPSFEETEAFATDERPDAYERLVDRLLASPHHGERWGRHWLDVVRYAETSGYERDQPKPHVWKYRDWVVRAFNEDMPFAQFAVEQLAGDERPDPSEASVIATGFLRLGTWNDEPNDPEEYKYERLEDMVDATSTAFLGLTVKCARCHDHKFDPIRQTDYYRMAAAFWAGPIEPGPRDWLGGPEPETLGFREVLGWTDRGREVPPLHLLRKGDPTRPGQVVEPGPLSVLPRLDRSFTDPPSEAATTRRRSQLAAWMVDPANPLTPRVWVNRVWQHHMGRGLVGSPDNFGFNGEPPTHPELLDWLASEFGDGGDSTKRLHRLIVHSLTYRQQSSPDGRESYAEADPGNRLWWRAERRRLDAESLRDALLAAGGRLDRSRLGGPSFTPSIASEALEGLSMKGDAWTASPPEAQSRRSLYIHSKRGLLLPLLTAFDFMDTTLPCGRRDVTLVAPQALVLLNNPFVHEQSEALARSVLSRSTDAPSMIRAAWRLTLGREPRPSELALAAEHLSRQRARFSDRNEAEFLALASLCHVLLNANEFLYVD